MRGIVKGFNVDWFWEPYESNTQVLVVFDGMNRRRGEKNLKNPLQWEDIPNSITDPLSVILISKVFSTKAKSRISRRIALQSKRYVVGGGLCIK